MSADPDHPVRYPGAGSHHRHRRTRIQTFVVPAASVTLTRSSRTRVPSRRAKSRVPSPRVYAAWLTGLGYTVHLVDPVPLHVEQAAARGGFSASLGDARRLTEPDESYDAVLMLGPLYHLVERADRLRALGEARRVVRRGGFVVAAAISRHASVFDGYLRGIIDEPYFETLVREVVRSGEHRNPDRHPRFSPPRTSTRSESSRPRSRRAACTSTRSSRLRGCCTGVPVSGNGSPTRAGASSSSRSWTRWSTTRT